jgi:hypothetical protein
MRRRAISAEARRADAARLHRIRAAPVGSFTRSDARAAIYTLQALLVPAFGGGRSERLVTAVASVGDDAGDAAASVVLKDAGKGEAAVGDDREWSAAHGL